MKLATYIQIICITIALSVFSESVFSQEKNNIGISVGGYLGISAYSTAETSTKVNPFLKSNASVGFVGIFDFSNTFFIQTGVSYTYFKSPFVDNISSFDELIQVPILFSFLRPKLTNSKNSMVISAGPLFSVLAAQGQANIQDEYYTAKDGMFGGLYKFGVITEIAIYSPRIKYLNSYGFKFALDIPALTLRSNSNVIVHDNYITGTFFLNINRKL